MMEEMFRMAGTTGSYGYTVFAATIAGRVGFRPLSGGQTRVRVEPTPESVGPLVASGFLVAGWKQPAEGNCRFSTVVDGDAVEQALVEGLQAIGVQCLPALVNPEAPVWAQALVPGFQPGPAPRPADPAVEALRAAAAYMRREAAALEAAADEFEGSDAESADERW